MPWKDEKALPPEPWHSFLKELDALAIGIVDFQCLGGFVVTQLYGLKRSTGDLDVLSIAPVEQRKDFLEKAGRGSALHKKYKIYLDYVGVTSIPYEYESRLVEMYPGVYLGIRLFALDPYDIALSKLCRNIARDREDVRYLAKQVPFDLQLLRERYRDEIRPDLLGIPENQDAILNLWIEMIEQDRQSELKK
jgi:uncharacterized nucleotidyltransferase DUF6036